MIPSVSTNRRANSFAQALGAPEPPEEEQSQTTGSDLTGAVGSPEPGRAEDGEHRALLAVAEKLGALPKPELDPEVKGVQRAQLIAAMEREFAGGQVPEQRGRSGRGAHRAQPQSALSRLRPKSRLTKGLAAGGLTVSVAAGALGGVAAASTDALPGDRLYGLKRGMEDFKLDMAGDDTARGKLHLDHASTRMHEARRLMERGKSGPLDHTSLGEVRKALGAMSSNAAEGRKLLSGAYSRDGDLGPLRSLSSFATSHRHGWTELRQQLPVQLQDISDEVNSVFDAINKDVSSVRELAPSQPDPGTPGGQPESGDHPNQRQDDGQPTAPDTGDSGGTSDDKDSQQPEDETSPDKPKPSPDEKNDGLLGGGSGLLDPPSGDGKGSGESDSRPPGPDITIPPLLPGGLPGLGLESDRDN